MGCGASREDTPTGQTHGQHPPMPTSHVNPMSNKSPVNHGATIAVVNRPPAGPKRANGAVINRPPAVAKRPAVPVDLNKPINFDDRVNSEKSHDHLQYELQGGVKIPYKAMEHQVRKAPPPQAPRQPGLFPKRYGNQEWQKDERGVQWQTNIFDDWEKPKGKEQLYEYPIKALDQRGPLLSTYDFAKKPAPFKKLKAVFDNEENIKLRWKAPLNHTGADRIVTTEEGQIVGAMYHPNGNPSGFERAKMSPLNAEGRKERVRVDDRVTKKVRKEDGTWVQGRLTWPERGPEIVGREF
ncbi:hypothetical protein QBC40DRAFT_277244 [Triangularia verruculosa]|uniref:Uncharacterized protein n=1 Tax=Triangularia verruculosa TaxID=2587418 RepID=A0AAN6XKC8_9PEZI|nr:hypothetical protein QBC40DRAFT_277244 [Triangularia verruculosa]